MIWEYRTLTFEGTRTTLPKKRAKHMAGIEDVLNEYGRAGWECISIFPTHTSTAPSLVVLLKRQINRA